MTEPKQGLHMIDPVQFGALMKSVEVLTQRLDAAARTQTDLTERLEAIESKMTAGRGVIAGLLLAAGLAAYGLKGMLDRWFA